MFARASLLIVVVTAALAGGVTPAFAALGDEVAAGGVIAKQVQAGTASCAKLSDTDFEHLGEYVMEQVVGSRSAHAAMNQRMASMMGTAAEERMHQLLGRRYAGCNSASSGAGAATGSMMGGGGMMGGSGCSPGWPRSLRCAVRGSTSLRRRPQCRSGRTATREQPHGSRLTPPT